MSKPSYVRRCGEDGRAAATPLYSAAIPITLISQPYLRFVGVLGEGRRGRRHIVNLSEVVPCFTTESIAELG